MTTSSPAPCRAKQNAPEAVGATVEGESQSRWSGSQNEVQTIIKEQIVNKPIMAATTDTDNPANGKGPHSARTPEVNPDGLSTADVIETGRSEERRVGKECPV